MFNDKCAYATARGDAEDVACVRMYDDAVTSDRTRARSCEASSWVNGLTNTSAKVWLLSRNSNKGNSTAAASIGLQHRTCHVCSGWEYDNKPTYCLTNKSLGGSVNTRSGLNMVTMDPRAVLEAGGVSSDNA